MLNIINYLQKFVKRNGTQLNGLSVVVVINQEFKVKYNVIIMLILMIDIIVYYSNFIF